MCPPRLLRAPLPLTPLPRPAPAAAVRRASSAHPSPSPRSRAPLPPTMAQIGDLSYADSEETRWDSWQSLIDYQSSHVPWQVIVGK